MKLTNQIIQDWKKENTEYDQPKNELIEYFLNNLYLHSDDPIERYHYLKDISEHGLDSAIVNELIYTDDVNKFFHNYTKDIIETIIDWAEEQGFTLYEYLALTTEKRNYAECYDTFVWLLVCIAYEYTAYIYLDRLEWMAEHEET